MGIKAEVLTLVLVLLCGLPVLGSASVVHDYPAWAAGPDYSAWTTLAHLDPADEPCCVIDSDVLFSDSRCLDVEGNLRLAGPIDDVINPLAASGGGADAQGGQMKVIPGTFLLTLAGFLCVTAVRDRRKWTALAALLLAAGGAGLFSIPRLAMRAASAHRKPLLPTGQVHRGRSQSPDVPLRRETNFAGLLRRLGASGGHGLLLTDISDVTGQLPAVGRNLKHSSTAGIFLSAVIAPVSHVNRSCLSGFAPHIPEGAYAKDFGRFEMHPRPPPLGNRVRERTARTCRQV